MRRWLVVLLLALLLAGPARADPGAGGDSGAQSPNGPPAPSEDR